MRQDRGVLCFIWQDKKLVRVMSSNVEHSVGTVQRRQLDGTRMPVPCPGAVISYNTCMRGVDRGDQLRGYYKSRSKSREFYHYVVWFLFDVTITNAFTLHVYPSVDQHTRENTIKQFQVEMADQLVGDYNSIGLNRPESGGTVPLLLSKSRCPEKSRFFPRFLLQREVHTCSRRGQLQDGKTRGLTSGGFRHSSICQETNCKHLSECAKSAFCQAETAQRLLYANHVYKHTTRRFERRKTTSPTALLKQAKSANVNYNSAHSSKVL